MAAKCELRSNKLQSAELLPLHCVLFLSSPLIPANEYEMALCT